MKSFQKAVVLACAASVLSFGVAFAQTTPAPDAAPAAEAAAPDAAAKPMMKKHMAKKHMSKKKMMKKDAM